MIIKHVKQSMTVWVILLCTGGCSLHPFSGSASMRIDVEVYKGPLSEEPEVQWAGLLADLREARKGLIETDNLVRAVIVNRDFKGINGKPPTEWPLPRTGVWDSAREEVRLEAYNAVEHLQLSDD